MRGKITFELSGGELQKVIVAAILAMNPEILVFDEPTSNMDPQSALNFLEYTVKINRCYNKTIIIVEHRLDFIIQYATKIIILDKGRIVAMGDPRKVLSYDFLEEIGVSLPQIPLLFKRLRPLLSYHELPLSINEALELIRDSICQK